jgi:hypothetical protein
MSTSYHPEMEGQLEHLNVVMEHYLRSFVLYQQDDWSKWLPIAEFAANNQLSASTGVSPFFANTGFHSRMNFQFPWAAQGPQELEAKAMAHKTEELLEHLKIQIQVALDRYATTTKKSRSPAPDLKAGDEGFNVAKTLHTEPYSRKLDWKKMGLFSVN